ncbi:MAG: apolipoprotein N-acyltransferase [Desulfarculaceae bacterium]|nr:apolipoprotein N-acyltransferase [Desulfarculaceae bacterium]
MPFALNHTWRLILVTCAVGLFAASSPGTGLSWLTWVAMLPFALAMRGVRPLCGLAWGLAYGLGIWLVAIWWLEIGLMAWVNIPAWSARGLTLLACLYHALPYAAFGLVCGWMNRRGRALGPLRAALWLGVLVSLFPGLFDGSLAHHLFDQPLFIQMADLGGAPLLLFLVVLVNWLGAELLAGLLRRRWLWSRAVALALVVAVVAGYGALRLNQFRALAAAAAPDRFVSLTVLQPNVPVRGQGPEPVQAALEARALALAQAAPPGSVALWPEVPPALDCGRVPGGQALASFLPGLAAKAGRPVIAACMDYEPGPGGSWLFSEAQYNAAAFYGPEGGIRAVYRKRKLFPFAEYLPLEHRFPWLRDLFPGAEHYRPGGGVVLFDLGPGARAIPTLCYEVLFPGLIRQGRAAGGNLIINLSDDAWFGSSQAAARHLSLALLRSVEFRVPLVRATNSGLGAHVAASGEIMPGSLTPAFKAATLSRAMFIPGADLRPLYPLIAPWLPWLGLVLIAGDALLARRSRRGRAKGFDPAA